MGAKKITKAVGKKNNRVCALSVTKPETQQERKSESALRNKVFVPFFGESNNAYINDLIVRSRRSPTHGAILRKKQVFTIGLGFSYSKGGEFIEPDEKFKKWESDVKLFKQFTNCSRDYIITGNAYLECAKGKEGKQTFFNVAHQDCTKVRKGVNKDKFFLSSFWRELGSDQTARKEYPRTEISANKEDERFIIHLASYMPEFEFYGLPDYGDGVLKWADIEYRIPTFNLDEFDNGFFPSAYIGLSGEPPTDMTPKKYVEKIVETFTGEGKNGKIFAELIDNKEMAAIIHEFGTVKDGRFKELDQLASSRIVNGHGWYPSLTGTAAPGSIGTNQQIKLEYELAMSTVIEPSYQVPLLELFNEVVKMAGFDIELGILTTYPVSFAGEIDISRVISKDEARELVGYEKIGDDTYVDDKAPTVETAVTNLIKKNVTNHINSNS